ncbi:MAG: sulfotransferase domain-containing protein [Aestuariibacter sp.]
MTNKKEYIDHETTIIAGMPRASSTWLYTVLANHPQVKLPLRKEIDFYGFNYGKGFDWYAGLFDKAAEAKKKSFDISPIYFLDKSFIAKYKQCDSNQKIILVLREPYDWVESLYWYLKGYDVNVKEFKDFITYHKMEVEGEPLELKLQEFDFMQVIEEFKKAFEGRLLLLDFNMVKENPVLVLKKIETFTGLQPYFEPSNTDAQPVNMAGQGFNIWSRLSTYSWFRNIVTALFPEETIVKAREKLIYNKTSKQNRNTQKVVGKDVFSKDLFKSNIFNGSWFAEF